MSRRIVIFLVTLLVIALYLAISFTGRAPSNGSSERLTEAALGELGADAIPHLR